MAPHYYTSCDGGGCGTNVLDQYLNESLTPTHSTLSHKGSVVVVSHFHQSPTHSVNLAKLCNLTHAMQTCNADFELPAVDGVFSPGHRYDYESLGTSDGGMSWKSGYTME